MSEHHLTEFPYTLLEIGQPERARPFFAEGLVAARKAGLRWVVRGTLVGLSDVCRVLGEYEVARRYAEEMASLAEGEWDWHSHQVIAKLLFSEKRFPEAREHYLHSLSGLRSASEDHIYGVGVPENLATLYVREEKWEQAARLLGACEAYREVIGRSASPSEHADFYDAALADLHAALDTDAFTAAWEKGRQMTFSQALEYALAEANV